MNRVVLCPGRGVRWQGIGHGRMARRMAHGSLPANDHKPHQSRGSVTFLLLEAKNNNPMQWASGSINTCSSFHSQGQRPQCRIRRKGGGRGSAGEQRGPGIGREAAGGWGGTWRVGRFGLKMSPLPYEAEGRMGALTVTASAGRLGPRLGDGDPLEDMGMFT